MQKKRAIQIGVIENAGPNTLVAFLRNAGAGCNEIDIAVAFITRRRDWTHYFTY